MATTVIAGPGAQSAPVAIVNTYQVGITPLTVAATFNGASASGDFIPCLSFYSQDGRLMGRYKGETTVTAGDTAVETFAPFLGRSSVSSVISALGVFDRTLTSATTTIDTTGTDISGGHVIEIWCISRCDVAGGGPTLGITFNGDTGSNYDYDWVRNIGGVTGVVDQHADTLIGTAQTGSSYDTSFFAVNRVTVPGYDQSTSGVFKVGEFTGYTPNSSTAPVGAQIRVFTGGLAWRNDARITSVQVFATGGGQLQAGSRLLVLRR